MTPFGLVPYDRRLPPPPREARPAMWHDDDLDDREWSDDEDEDDDQTVPCLHCRRPVYEDAERCPSCGRYLTREDLPWRRPVWLVAGVLIGLLIVAYWTFRML